MSEKVVIPKIISSGGLPFTTIVIIEGTAEKVEWFEGDFDVASGFGTVSKMKLRIPEKVEGFKAEKIRLVLLNVWEEVKTETEIRDEKALSLITDEHINKILEDPHTQRFIGQLLLWIELGEL